MKGPVTHVCAQTPDMQLHLEQRSLHCMIPMFIFHSSLPMGPALHSIVRSLVVITSAVSAHPPPSPCFISLPRLMYSLSMVTLFPSMHHNKKCPILAIPMITSLSD